MRALAVVSVLCATACATLANEAGDLDVERPNALAGPFRLLKDPELSSKDAPYILKKRYSDFRDPSVIAEGSELGPTTLYATVTSPSGDSIQRFSAPDGRSFDPAGADVLTPTESWEGGAIAQPSVARVNGELWLAYAAAGGIGLARSSDGETFVKDPAPVLEAGGDAWEGGVAPQAPALLALNVLAALVRREAPAKRDDP